MYSRHLFPYGGLKTSILANCIVRNDTRMLIHVNSGSGLTFLDIFLLMCARHDFFFRYG